MKKQLGDSIAALQLKRLYPKVQSLGKLMVKNVATFPQVLPKIAADMCGIIIKNI